MVILLLLAKVYSQDEFVRYNDMINLTNIGTGNHESITKGYVGFCGVVNVGLQQNKGIGKLKIIRD